METAARKRSGIQNDLQTWAARARAKGHDTIEIHVDLAGIASDTIASQADDIERLRAELQYIAKQWPDSFAARHAISALKPTQNRG